MDPERERIFKKLRSEYYSDWVAERKKKDPRWFKRRQERLRKINERYRRRPGYKKARAEWIRKNPEKMKEYERRAREKAFMERWGLEW